MRRTLCAAVVAAGLVAAPAAEAAEDAFNSRGLRKAVTVERLLEHEQALQGIAEQFWPTRESGTPGYAASRDYVVGKLEAAGYSPVVQEFEFPFFQLLADPEFDRVSPNPATYTFGASADFAAMTYSGSGNVTAPTSHVVDRAGGAAGAGCDAADFAGYPAGSVALIQRGSCSFKIKATNAQAAGASAVVIYNNIDGPLNGTLGSPGQSIPVIGTLKSIGEEQVALLGGPVTLHVETSTQSDIRKTWNVLADTAGGRADRTIVVGAHLDSRLEGPGINDNGSGSAAILEIAEQFAERGIQPTNRVRFAWWGAEEFNLLGSTHYVNSLSESELADIEANLNFDMLASPNYVRFVYDGDNSAFPVGPQAAAGPKGSGLIERVFISYFDNQGLATDPTPFSGRSDYGPFIAQGIPAGGLFSGAEQIKTARQAEIYGGTAGVAYDACYHLLCDDIDNLNLQGFEELADATAHAVYTFAMTPFEVSNDKYVKPGANGEPKGTNDAGGTGSGGGHEDGHTGALG